MFLFLFKRCWSFFGRGVKSVWMIGTCEGSSAGLKETFKKKAYRILNFTFTIPLDIFFHKMYSCNDISTSWNLQRTKKNSKKHLNGTN